MCRYTNDFMYSMYVDMGENVVKLEDILNGKSSDGKENNVTSSKDIKPEKKKKKKKASTVPKGARKSGRFWKNERDKPSNMNKTRGIKKANKFHKLKQLKEELNRIRTLSKNIVDARNEEIEQKKERRRRNLKRQEENRLKSEIVQEIKNPAKIKRMKRKHLRTIEKRDTLKVNKD